ncbi:sodium-dependent serotonin transporter isoform X2 [Procambarus clarkii]|uniref:sodium-dependent serotonin transporter isoform X2 n=1 Tax=Procambarus clarkii TaxID=6728 RepID=UPI001E6714A6|nr:sodium-dependent serotonin transporter-like isoform X2 [Procambarus clarkii]
MAARANQDREAALLPARVRPSLPNLASTPAGVGASALSTTIHVTENPLAAPSTKTHKGKADSKLPPLTTTTNASITTTTVNATSNSTSNDASPNSDSKPNLPLSDSSRPDVTQCDQSKATATTLPPTALPPTVLPPTTSPNSDPPPPYQLASDKVPCPKWTENEPERDTWGKKVEFLLAVVGFAVDLGNVWRFPYICYQNGGGAFLVPYVIMLVFGGLPLFFMELALGQYHRSGCLTVWRRICPMLKGIGYAICIIDLYMAMYYNTILAWSVYYLVASFGSELPWTSCDNDWNTPNCTLTANVHNATDKSSTVSPAKEFFRKEVLEVDKSTGLGDLGPVKGSLALCLFSVFVLVYFSLWKGVKSSGKAVWVTALMPYVVLLILLVRGVTLPGATSGILYYLTPRFQMLDKPKVWVDAATQIFFSLGPGFGTLLALSSYNKFHNNCYRDALLTSSINCLTSFLAGFVIFSVLGYMAHVQNKDISEVGEEGPGLVFTVYPEAIATMTGSVFWSIIFFLMLITLGLDSTFGGLEAMITGLCDEYPRLLGRHREIFVLCLLIFIYVCALPTTTYGGMYIVDLLNIFGTGNPILFIVFVEATAVCWFYGAERFADDIEKMLGFRPGRFWIVCWKFISPTFIFVLFVCSFALGDGAAYLNLPPWAVVLAWVLTCSSIVCIPLYIIYMFIITPGTFKERIKAMIKPEEYNPPQLSQINSNYGTHV